MKAAFFFCVIASAAVAAAHPGQRVWIGNVGGTVTTFTSDNDLNPTTFTPAQVFSSTLQNLTNIFTSEFPGYEVRTSGGGVAGGTTFGIRLTGPLLVLDSSTDSLKTSRQQFGPPSPGPVPQMGVSRGSSFRITNQTVQDGFDFFTFNEIGDHEHLNYTLLGNGVNPGGGPDGVYVLPLMLTADTLARSDWYFLVLSKNAPVQQTDRARFLAQDMADALPGDANFDGIVNIGDFARLATNFNKTDLWWADGDFSFDGVVNIGDFSLLAANFNQGSGRGVVPEPTVAALACAGLLLYRRRRSSDKARNTCESFSARLWSGWPLP